MFPKCSIQWWGIKWRKATHHTWQMTFHANLMLIRHYGTKIRFLFSPASSEEKIISRLEMGLFQMRSSCAHVASAKKNIPKLWHTHHAGAKRKKFVSENKKVCGNFRIPSRKDASGMKICKGCRVDSFHPIKNDAQTKRPAHQEITNPNKALFDVTSSCNHYPVN